MEKPREIAARLLLDHRKTGQFLDLLLDQSLREARLSPADARLVHEMVYGVVRWERTLDWAIAPFLQHPPSRAILQILLRLGAYQLLFLDRIPPHAAVHETVNVLREMRLTSQVPFVNAILRRLSAGSSDLRTRIQALQKENPALGFSHPDWLVDRWRERWTVPEISTMLAGNNSAPPTYARFNSLKGSVEELTAAWNSEQVDFHPVQHAAAGSFQMFEISASKPIPTLPSFQKGFFYLQDPSTLLAVSQLNPQPGEEVLDLCAAPGGKTTAMAQAMGNRGMIVAEDPQPKRLELVYENLRRLGATCIHPAASPESGSASVRQFDRVLVDAPCSNTGVMRRRVELRWRIQPDEIKRLAQLQQQLLKAAARRLKPGGTLVYSTCSLESEENEEVVRNFLEQEPSCHLLREKSLLPFRDQVDGAYVATFTQK